MRDSILNKTAWSLAALTGACLIVAGNALAQQAGEQPAPPPRGDQAAQPQRPADQSGRGWQPGGDFRQRFQGGGMDWGQMIRGMGAMQPATVVASGEFLFIVRGNTLYQYDIKTLKQINKVQLETEPLPLPFPAGQGAPGGAPAPMPRPRTAPAAGGQDNPPPPAP
jgi:hypothetical protein